MNERICPFSATLVKGDFGCSHADQIIRRGGAEFACRSATAHARCQQLLERLKVAALPEFDVRDDLATMPQSVMVKIQFGGLLGLQRLLAAGARPDDGIANIDGLLETALARYGSVGAIPCNQLVDDITAYRLQRRRDRRGS